MPSAFQLIGRNPALQEHWIRRLLAFILDAIVVVLVFLLVSIPVGFLSGPAFLSATFWGLIWFLYSLGLETAFGGTIGKKLFALRVVAIDRNLDVVHTLGRNLPKVFPLVILIDLLLGAATQGDPRQRLFDRLARTTVTRVDQGAYMEEQFRMMQHGMPHPMTIPPAPTPQAPPPAPGSKATTASAGWPGQTPTQSGWPQHEWDEEGKLIPEKKFCTACGGSLVTRGDGKLTCVRCGAVY